MQCILIGSSALLLLCAAGGGLLWWAHQNMSGKELP